MHLDLYLNLAAFQYIDGFGPEVFGLKFFRVRLQS